jgi:4'-phosphopantetheinyl transferase
MSDPFCTTHWMSAKVMSAEDEAMLTDSELRRMRRMRQPADRTRFACATALARRVLAAETGTDPREIVIDRRCGTCGLDHGRPRTPGLGLFVSLAHAGTVVGVAVSRCGPVGLDLEPTGGRDLMALASEVLGPGETARSSDDMLRYWTRKESLVKATGDGIGVGLTGVVVSLPEDPPLVLAYPGQRALRAQMADLRCSPGYLASVAVLTGEPVRFHERWHGLRARGSGPGV